MTSILDDPRLHRFVSERIIEHYRAYVPNAPWHWREAQVSDLRRIPGHWVQDRAREAGAGD